MQIREAMTISPISLFSDSSVLEAARAMTENKVGDVIVRKNGRMVGIVTDRDLVVRVLAEGKDPRTTDLESVCTHPVLTVFADDSVGDTIRLMRERAVRRVPVMDGEDVVGIVSLGDLASRLDPASALGTISAAPPNN